MKKLIYSTLIALAGLFTTSCVQEHIDAVYDPGKVTAQTLSEIPGCTLDVEGKEITTTFNPVDYNMKVAVKYVLYASKDDSFAEKTDAGATISITDGKGQISLKQPSLNSLVYALGGEQGVPFTIYFQLYSYMADDKNNGIESTLSKSNIVSSEFTPYAMDIKDVDLYPHVWVIGASSAVGAWSFDKVHQYLYDYDKTGNTYTGLIDFGEDGPSGGFKFTGVGNWDDATKNWGSEAQAEEPEATSVQLVAGGSSKDIKCYSKRFYSFTFNTTTLVLVPSYSFNNIGIVGAFNGWNAADETAKMAYNPYYHRFYIDWTFDEATELKFTCDDSWDLNWGKDFEPGGPNIPVEAGSYRVYFDLNKKNYEFNKNMFGKDEPGEEPQPGPEPEPYKGWGITGSIASAGINWDGDVEMKEAAGVWTGFVTLATSDMFKLRKDADWAENFGGPGDVEPYIIADGTPFEAVAGGKNMGVPADGFYKIVYDSNANTITVASTVNWGVIGDFNSWSADVFMTETDGKFVSPAITLEAGKGFKIRKNSGWDDNRGATGDVEPFVVPVGEAFDVVGGGKNLTVPADGQYIITYDPSKETIVVDAALPQNCWSLIGEISGSGWDKDFYMTESNGLWVSDAVELLAGKGFKIRFNNDWGVNRGAAEGADPVMEIGKIVLAGQDGANLSVAADGTYRVVYDPAQELIYFVGWSVIGQVNGTSWDTDIVMTPVVEDGQVIWMSPVFSTEGGFKIRYNSDWAVNRGAEGSEEPYIITSAVPIKAVQDGKNLGTKEENGKYYRIIYNETADSLSVLNCSWSVIGQVNGSNWDKDILMYEVEGSFFSEPFTVEGGFKIRFNRDWTVNRGAAGDADPYPVVVGEPIAGAQDGKNLSIDKPEGLYSIIYNKASEVLMVLSDND